jgi:hypothetical protein
VEIPLPDASGLILVATMLGRQIHASNHTLPHSPAWLLKRESTAPKVLKRISASNGSQQAISTAKHNALTTGPDLDEITGRFV